MADIRGEGIFIQAQIKMPSQFGEFNDALYYTFDDFDALSEDDLAIARRARRDAWVDTILNPPPVIEPTKEELIAQRDELAAQVLALQAQIDIIN